MVKSSHKQGTEIKLRKEKSSKISSSKLNSKTKAMLSKLKDGKDKNIEETNEEKLIETNLEDHKSDDDMDTENDSIDSVEEEQKEILTSNLTVNSLKNKRNSKSKINENKVPVDEIEPESDNYDSDDSVQDMNEGETSKNNTLLSYDGSYQNKQRVLVFASRGITARYRHLLDDLRKLIPHHKKDVKLDTKGDLQVINEIAEMKSCNNCLFLESRKKQDLYMWISKTPFGPSVKFHVQNVHTMDELKLTGNSMLGSRPILNFEDVFDDVELNPHLNLLKLLFMDAFGTPRGHPKSKPFIDRIMSFSISDSRIWIRNYQVVDRSEAGKLDMKALKQGKLDEITSLVEIGPRFCLNPIRIFSGSFGGPTLYQNPDFVSPNFIRAETKRTQGKQMASQLHSREETKKRKEAFELTPNEIQDVFKV